MLEESRSEAWSFHFILSTLASMTMYLYFLSIFPLLAQNKD